MERFLPASIFFETRTSRVSETFLYCRHIAKVLEREGTFASSDEIAVENRELMRLLLTLFFESIQN